MPRIVLEFTKPGPKNDRYCIWCDEVPPPLGGGPGNLVIPNVERLLHGTPGDPNSYEYIIGSCHYLDRRPFVGRTIFDKKGIGFLSNKVWRPPSEYL